MHELTIARNILEIVCQATPEEHYARAEFVKVKLGKFSNVLPEALRFSFEVIKENYGLKNINLIIKEEPLHLRCIECGALFDSQDAVFSCMVCKGSSLEVLDGDLLKVSEIGLREEK